VNNNVNNNIENLLVFVKILMISQAYNKGKL